MLKAFIDTVIMACLAGINVAASVFMYQNTELSAPWSVFVCSLVLMSLASVLVNFKQSRNIHYTEVNIHGAEKVKTIEKTDNPENIHVNVDKEMACTNKKTLTPEHKAKLKEATKKRKRKNGRFV